MRIVSAILALLLPLGAMGQPAADFDDWLEREIQQRLSLRSSVRGGAKQAEAPAASTNSSTIVDTSSASDLVGLALNFAGLTAASEDGSGESNSSAVTLSGYAISSAFQGGNPLDPARYCKQSSRNWRRLSTTFGYDDTNKDEFGDVFLLGAKLVIWDDRDPCSDEFGEIARPLLAATRTYGSIVQEVDAFMTAEGDEELWQRPTPALARELDRTISPRLADFVALDEGIASAIGRYQRNPIAALQFLTKQRDKGGDVYETKFTVDYSPYERLGLTLNAGWEVVDSSHGGRLAAGITFKPFGDRLVGRRPVTVALAGDARWLSNASDQYRGQLKLSLPLFDGFELPLSVTVANRTELVDETDVRGLIGFTLDTAQLWSWLDR